MRFFSLIVFILLTGFGATHAQPATKDTVKVGIYFTSIHNIDFRQKEFTITFWLWLKYKKKELDFINNLEIPNSKTVEKAFSTLDTSQGHISLTMKIQCVMKDSWVITNFPFDEQMMHISIENSQYDTGDMVFVADTLGEHYDRKFTLQGWNIDSCVLSTGIRNYETAFGNEDAETQHSEYSTFQVHLSVTRNAAGLFWKMFLGMYLAFLIAFICFYIHPDNMDSRFGLSVGALFAVIGNKYIIDSSLPESSSFTLVDLLHGVTLFYILVIVAANAYSLKLFKSMQVEKARRFDRVFSRIVLISYLLLNFWFIRRAVAGTLIL